MSNIYIGQFKDIVKLYAKQQDELNHMIEENNKRYSPEYAEIENKKVYAKKDKLYHEATEQINSVFADVRELLAMANFPNVEKLTADRLFFESDSFDLSVEEVKAYVERYKDNPTMLRIIKDYTVRHNHTDTKMTLPKYADVVINTPSDMLGVYKKFGASALRMCNNIYANGTINESELQAFGDENFAQGLFAVIGNGMSLREYRSSRIPETAKHSFDNISLTSTEV